MLKISGILSKQVLRSMPDGDGIQLIVYLKQIFIEVFYYFDCPTGSPHRSCSLDCESSLEPAFLYRLRSALRMA
jgi:hypothetical protein